MCIEQEGERDGLKKQLKAFLILIICLLISSSCNHAITEEQAISIVRLRHEQNKQHGNISIISVTHSKYEYTVTWERKSNCENGTEQVSMKSGKITGGIYSIC
jgi:hypothetical protein